MSNAVKPLPWSGPTGGGKSTTVNLLCRFYEPSQGVIGLAVMIIQITRLHAIQSRIGIVLQTPHLFSGSIRENIRYGCLDATDSEVEEAAKVGWRARIHPPLSARATMNRSAKAVTCFRWVKNN